MARITRLIRRVVGCFTLRRYVRTSSVSKMSQRPCCFPPGWILFTALIVFSCVMAILMNNSLEKMMTKVCTTPDEETRQVMEARRNLYLKGCNEYSIGVRLRKTDVITNNRHRLAWCPVAKAGSTFWKRVFRYIFEDDFRRPIKIENVLQFDRYYIHHTFKKLQPIDYATTAGVRGSLGYFKFMMARDPYERLWAAYLDKILLVDYWDSNHGTSVLDFMKKIGVRVKNNNSNFCLNEISFLNYSLGVKDKHWSPISSMCDPCTFVPDVIGKMESFSRDRDFILREAKLPVHPTGDVLHKHYEEEVKSITDYNYHTNLSKPCITDKQLARRLWLTFQLNGYIRTDTAFPEKEIDGAVKNKSKIKENVKEVFIRLMQRDPITPEESHNQRKRALRSAYTNMPQEIMGRIQEKFAEDFVLFGYDPVPPILTSFQNRPQGK